MSADLERALTAPAVSVAGRVIALHLDVDDAAVLAHVLGLYAHTTADLSHSEALRAGVSADRAVQAAHVDGFDPERWRGVVFDLLAAKAEVAELVHVKLIDPTLGTEGAQEPPC